MTVSYYSAFDLRRLTWGITLTPTSGGTAVTLTSASFEQPCHIHAPQGVSEYELASDPNYEIEDDPELDAQYGTLVFGSTCAFYANTGAAAWTVPTVLTFAFDMATHRYTISRSSGDTFALSFTGDGAAMFGFAGASSAATTHLGTLTPLYAIRASSPAMSADSGHREPGGQSSTVVSDACSTWSTLARTASPIFRSWEQRFETQALVWREFADSTNPWTFQDLYRLARTGLPFAVRDTSVTRQGLYVLRDDEFFPQPHGENNHAQVMVRFDCQQIGTRAV